MATADQPSSGESSSSVGLPNINGNGIKLYYWYTSFYSQRALMALYEKKIPFSTQVVSLLTGENHEAWFLRLNPRAELPVLTDGMKIIPDSIRIVEYLEDNFRNGRFGQLMPHDKGSEESQKISKFREALEALPIPSITYGLMGHPDLASNTRFPFTKVVRSRMKASAIAIDKIYLKSAMAVPEELRSGLLQKIKEFEDGSRKLVLDREAYDECLQKVDEILIMIEEELSSHTVDQDWWLCGETFSIADIDLAILLNRLWQLGLEARFWSSREHSKPNLARYFERIKMRDSFRRATRFTPMMLRMSFLNFAFRKHKGLLFSLSAAVMVAFGAFIAYKYISR